MPDFQVLSGKMICKFQTCQFRGEGVDIIAVFHCFYYHLFACNLRILLSCFFQYLFWYAQRFEHHKLRLAYRHPDITFEFLEEDTTKFAYKAETTSRFLTVDPLAEEYYSWSPYVYVGNNPIKRTDPTGMDWYEDKDGSYQYDPKINKNSKLGEGQKYTPLRTTSTKRLID